MTQRNTTPPPKCSFSTTAHDEVCGQIDEIRQGINHQGNHLGTVQVQGFEKCETSCFAELYRETNLHGWLQPTAVWKTF